MRGCLSLLAALVLCACASTTVNVTGARPAKPLCQGAGEQVSALVVWSTEWRPDQKDIALRERAAEQGLQRFLALPGCFALSELRQVPAAGTGSAADAARLADESSLKPQRVVFVVVRELGPVVKLLSSAALVDGGTEVKLDIASHRLQGAAGSPFSLHWRNGGAGVIKGVDSLPQDMAAALAAAFGSGAATPP